jgi:hypothetical protein
LTRLGKYESVNNAESVADANACVFVIVIVSKAVPPAEMLLGEKLLAIVGLDKATASISAAEQTPAVIEPHELVLLTLAGGVMEAVLVTNGCA